jgi:hypothetical protein
MAYHGFHLGGYLNIHRAIRRQMRKYEKLVRSSGVSYLKLLVNKFEFNWELLEEHSHIEDTMFLLTQSPKVVQRKKGEEN